MPWKASSVMDERLKFVGRLLSGEKVAPLCRESGISRVTGHKIWKRYQEQGASGIKFRSRARHAHPNQTPFEVEQIILVVVLIRLAWHNEGQYSVPPLPIPQEHVVCRLRERNGS
jgi:hypothetical protein